MVYSRRSIGDLQVLIDMIRRYDFHKLSEYTVNVILQLEICSLWQPVYWFGAMISYCDFTFVHSI